MQRAKDLLVWLAVISGITGAFYVAGASTDDGSAPRARASGVRAPGSPSRPRPPAHVAGPAGPLSPMPGGIAPRFAAP